MKEPKRLLSNQWLDPDLSAALRALQQQGPAPEVVLRTQRALEALPPAAATKGNLTLTKLIGLTSLLALGGMVSWIGVRGLPLLDPPLPRLVQPSAADTPPPPTAAEPVVTPTPAESPETVAPAAAAVANAETDRELPATRRAARGSRREPLPSKPAGRAPATVDTAASPAAGHEPVQPTAAEARNPSDEHARPPSQPAPRVAASAARLPRTVSEPREPEPADEAGLLFRAKRLEGRDPSRALRLLELHAFYFPNGAFVEEREVLMIKLHQRLGHLAEAKARAARFRARFPESVYRAAALP